MKNISISENRKYWEERAWKEFLESSKNAKSLNQLTEFFDSLLSNSEKKVIMRRLSIFSMLKAGKSYKEISKNLWVSSKTVSAIKKSIVGNKRYKSSYYYDELSKKEKSKKIKPLSGRTIFDYWADFPFPTKYGSGRWKYLNYQD